MTVDSVNLLEIAQDITSSTDLDTVLGKIGLITKKLLNTEASSIMLVDETAKNLYFKVALGDKAGTIKKFRVPIGTGIAGWVAQNLKPLMVNDVFRDARFAAEFDRATGFETKSLLCAPMFARGSLLGVVEVVNKIDGAFTEHDLGLLVHLAGLAAIAINNAQLVEGQRNFFSHILEVLALSIETISPKFIGHPWRSQKIALACARRLNIAPEEISDLAQASLLHDIGYLVAKNPKWAEALGVAALPQGPISERQLEFLHPVFGEKVLSGVELFRGCLPLIRHHSENFDGTGFPDKLRGKNIPLGAKILGLVEVVEEVRATLGSSSREKLLEQVKGEVIRLSSTKLDPVVAQAFLAALEDDEIF